MLGASALVGWGFPASGVRAAGAHDAYFAGYGFLANAADIASNFTHLSALLTPDRSRRLEAALVVAARAGNPRRGVNLRADELGHLAHGQDAYVLALTFDREVVSASRIGATWKLLVELQFQVLVFDFATMMIVASYPLAVQYIDAMANRPDDTDIARAMDRLVFGDQASGLQATFWQEVGGLVLPPQGARTLKVTDVSLAPLALSNLEQLGVGRPEPLAGQLAHDFGKFLAANQALSILPYASSQAVGAKMAARMSNGSVYSLSMPEPDYAISLRLDGLKKVQTSATAAGAAWVYGAFCTIRIFEPLSNRDYFKGQVKLGATRTVAAGSSDSDDWPSFAEAIEQLFNEFTAAISASDDAWAHKHIAAGAGAAVSLKPLKDLIASCR